MDARGAIFGAVLLVSCGSSGPAGVPGLSVGGTYQTQVTLLPGNSCGSVTVQDAQTTVAQTPGSGSLSLTHAGNTYPGTVDHTGHFSTPAQLVAGKFNISIAGQFSLTGFDATVQVDQISPQCSYQVHWVGTKSGSPNTFP